ncbi:MAG: CHAT domain-containing protein [Gemmatimonadales bacterium]
MEYLDFELRIAPGTGRDYPVTVLQSPAGETTATMSFPFDTLALQNHLQGVEIAVLKSASTRRDVVSEEHVSVSDFGRGLFEALMATTVRETFRRSQDRARASGKGLRVRLRIEAPELASLPWEYLYDAAEGDYICLSSDTPLVRYLEFDRPPEPLIIQPPLSILGVIASPSDRPPLDVDREKQRVEAATAPLRNAGLLKLTWLQGSTWRDLQKAMRQGPYHIFHFVGHGGFDVPSGEGVIALTDDEGKMALMSATQLGRLLADHNSLRMVVLNSCLGAKGSATDIFSSTASILVRRGVSAVVAMQYEISDRAAVEFARALYEALADGMPVDAAVAEARKAISLSASNTVEWGTPVLHMRSPDGALFRIDGMTTSVARASGVYHAVPASELDALAAKPAAPPVQAAPTLAAAPAPAPTASIVIPAPPAAPRSGSKRPRWLVAGAAGVLVIGALIWFRPGSGDAPAQGLAAPGPNEEAAAPGAAATAPTWLSTEAKINDVTAEFVSPGLWNLIVAVDYTRPAVAGEALVTCSLREGTSQEQDVPVPVALSPDSSGGQYQAEFNIPRRWADGQYPVVCTVGDATAYEGNVAWSRGN